MDGNPKTDQRRCPCGHAIEIEDVTVTALGTCPACGSSTSDVFRHRPDSDSDITPIEQALEAFVAGSVDQTPTETNLSPFARTATPNDVSPGDLPPEPTEGTNVGRFKLLERLGRGGMGAVFRAHDPDLNREVAIKFLSAHLSANSQYIERFRREARAVARLSHPNLTHIYSIGEEQGRHYFVMELVDGRSLSQVLETRGTLPYRKAADYIRQTAEGLAFAYTRVQIIHRDLKPSNLMLTDDGRIKVTDFGLAKLSVEKADITRTGTVLGTPLYMPPEQGQGKHADHRSDIYALGATFYHLIYGRPPFEGQTALQIMMKHAMEEPRFEKGGNAPAAAVRILRRTLKKRPGDRYAEYEPFIEDLARLAAGDLSARDTDKEREITYLTVKADEGSGTTLEKSRLRLAETNFRMGRKEKAINLLREMVASDSPIRLQAALKLIQFYEEEGNQAELRELSELLFEEAEDPAMKAYAGWRIGTDLERQALAMSEKALEALEAIPLEEGVPANLIQAKIEELRAHIEQADQTGSQSDLRLRSES